jgi:sortase (surface protein transpeptidase)
VVVEGSGPDQLAQGPGHYVGTAMPGQPGNVTIAGHRVGKGSLTLTTCHPKFSARQRLVVHAAQDGAPLAKADAPAGPPALTGG